MSAEEFQKLFERALAGESLSAEESRQLNSQDNAPLLGQALKARGIDPTSQEGFQFLSSIRARDQSLTEEQRRKRDSSAIDAFNVASGLKTARDLVTATKQIREGDRTTRDLEANVPQYQQTAQISPYLQQRLAQARIRSETGLSPAQRAELSRENNDAYVKALDNAKAVGGGQAGTYGALAQQAALDRMRGNLKVAALDEQSRQQNTAAYDNLIPQEQQAREFQAQQQDARFNHLALPLYQAKLANAARLSQTGRQNLGSTLALLPSQLGHLTREYYDVNAQRGIAPPQRQPMQIPDALVPTSIQPLPITNNLAGRLNPGGYGYQPTSGINGLPPQYLTDEPMKPLYPYRPRLY